MNEQEKTIMDVLDAHGGVILWENLVDALPYPDRAVAFRNTRNLQVVGLITRTVHVDKKVGRGVLTITKVGG